MVKASSGLSRSPADSWVSPEKLTSSHSGSWELRVQRWAGSALFQLPEIGRRWCCYSSRHCSHWTKSLSWCQVPTSTGNPGAQGAPSFWGIVPVLSLWSPEGGWTHT